MATSRTGQGGKTLNDRKLAASVRTLTLREIEKILKRPEMDDLKQQLIMKLAPSILPRLNEHTGEDGGALVIQFDNAFASSPKGDSEQ